MRPLVILETHPVQYHAPVYREAAKHIPLAVVYGSDFSVTGYQDREFGRTFAWDTDLLSGYESHFLRRVEQGGAVNYDAVLPDGLDVAVRQLNPAAVLAVGYASSFDRGALRTATQFGCPLLFRAETTDSARQRSWWKGRLRDGWLRRQYRNCARLLFVGERSRAHYRRLGVAEDRLVFSPYCVDTTPFRFHETDRAELREAIRNELELSADEIVILFSGKLVRRKGVDLLPDAVRRLPAELRERIVLAFLGDGELREQLQADAVRPPSITTRFFGFQNQTTLSRYYHAADLLVLPSREGETWGLVVNEALHHGVPVVASDAVGSTSDLVKPGLTGEVCATDSPDALAQAIAKVAPLIGQADVREQCRAVVASYGVAAAAQGITTAFQSVAL